VLRSLGYGEREIRALLDRGVAIQA
jgi:hypothetical protein